MLEAICRMMASSDLETIRAVLKAPKASQKRAVMAHHRPERQFSPDSANAAEGATEDEATSSAAGRRWGKLTKLERGKLLDLARMVKADPDELRTHLDLFAPIATFTPTSETTD